MAATYSQTTSGLNSTLFEVDELYVLNDAQAQVGSQQLAMQQGLAFLVQGPDGAQGLYQIDAERSIPGQPPVLRALFP
jgi:hypothetical protein